MKESKSATYYVIPTVWYSGQDKTIEIIKRSMVARGWGMKKNE